MKKPSFKVLVYIQQFLGECMPIYPLYALMFSERSGLTNSEISWLFLSWVIIALLAEVPTGIVADKFSRKAALMYSYILQGGAFLIWLVFPNFWGYALGFLIWGIGYAFMSGTFQAYLYEELKAHGQAKSFNEVYARSQSIELIGMVFAYVVAAVIGAKNYSAALIISATFSFLAAGAVACFPYLSKQQRDKQEVTPYVSVLTNAAREVRHNKKVFAYVIALGILMGIVGTMEEYTPLFYKHVGFSTEVVPIILAAGLLLSSLFGWFAHKLERMRYATVSLFVVAAGLLLYAATFGKIIGLISVIAFMRLIMLAETLFGASLQHTIQDTQRATVNSLAAFGGEVLSLTLIAVAGVFFVHLSDTSTYRILAVIFVLLGIVLVAIGRRRHLRVDAPTAEDITLLPGRPV